MKVFGIVGSGVEILDFLATLKCPPGYIEMVGQRPSTNHIAKADGTWELANISSDNIQNLINFEVEHHLTNVAKTRNYDSIKSASVFIGNSINPQWSKEGEALRDWAILVYEKSHKIQEDVISGKYPLPSFTELIDMLPEMIWPDD